MAEMLGTFELMILLAVVDLGEEAYGRAVFRGVEDAFQDSRRLSAGAMYTTLNRLEEKGLLTSTLEPGTSERAGRQRRFYRITALGAGALNQTRHTLERLWKDTPWPLEVHA